MKYLTLMTVIITPLAAHANSSAAEIYMSATTGVITAIGSIILVVLYQFGKFISLKIMPAAPLWAQRVAGVTSIILGFSLLAAIT